MLCRRNGSTWRRYISGWVGFIRLRDSDEVALTLLEIETGAVTVITVPPRQGGECPFSYSQGWVSWTAPETLEVHDSTLTRQRSLVPHQESEVAVSLRSPILEALHTVLAQVYRRPTVLEAHTPGAGMAVSPATPSQDLKDRIKLQDARSAKIQSLI